MIRLTQSSDAQSISDWRQMLEELSRERKQWQYKRGDRIKMEPEYVWVVVRGVVQLNIIHANGDEGIVGLAYPSTSFGLAFTQIEPYEAIALSQVVLLRFHLAEVEQSPQLAKALIKGLTQRVQQTEALLSLLGCRPIKERLKQFICLLHHEMGESATEGVRFPFKLTHEQIASIIGSTRGTVTRCLKALKKEGIQL